MNDKTFTDIEISADQDNFKAKPQEVNNNLKISLINSEPVVDIIKDKTSCSLEVPNITTVPSIDHTKETVIPQIDPVKEKFRPQIDLNKKGLDSIEKPSLPVDSFCQAQRFVNRGEGRYYFRERKPKRKRYEQNDEEERDAKMIRSMIALITGFENQEEYAFPSMEIPVNQMRTHGKELVKLIEQAFLVALTEKDEIFNSDSKISKEVNGIKIPKNYKEAVNDPLYSGKWKDAIQEEINSLIANGTWEELLLPDGANLVSTKWVFDVKRTVSGETDRFKARLVARGFSQQQGVDYTETFAPTVRADTLRMFLALVAKENLECMQYDIKNAFTESHLKENIYLAPPEGYNVKKGHALRALRSLYGLKQAGRDWNLLLRKSLLEIGFVQSLADPCLYNHLGKDIKLLVYVDDIVAASQKLENLSWFYGELSSRFNTKDLGRSVRSLALESLEIGKVEPSFWIKKPI